MRSRIHAILALVTGVVVISAARKCLADNGYTLTTLANFDSNNSTPGGNFVRDSAGNFYGTSLLGGTFNLGTVYKVDAANGYNVTTLASLNGPFPKTGSILRPIGVAMDPEGNLFGSTSFGGDTGMGTVFKVDATSNHTLTTLMTFNGTNGMNPNGVIIDKSGNLYGNAGGIAYKLDASNNYSLTPILTNSTGISSLMDASGNLYGMTNPTASNAGSIFRLDASSNFSLTTLATFDTNIGNYSGTLAFDLAGNIYGSTIGQTGSHPATVFELNAANSYKMTVLTTFTGINSGSIIPTGLVVDANGNVFGVTQSGGTSDSGSVFELAAADAYNRITLVNFGNGNGAQPVTNLILDSAGNLYGQTSAGGLHGDGTIFMLSPTAVPEPASLVVAGIGAIVLFKRQRKNIAAKRL